MPSCKISTIVPCLYYTDSHRQTPTPTPVQNSYKRGLAYNDPNYTKFFSLSGQGSKVSWAYNWYSTPYSKGEPTSGFNPALRFIPMLWSNASDLTSVWNVNVNAAISKYRADAILAFNEPDGCGNGGSCMSVAASVEAYKKWIVPFKGKVLLGAPAVTNGEGTGIGLSYLSSFLSKCTGTSCPIDFIPIHWYGYAGDPTGFKNYVIAAHQVAGTKPLWITEFGCTAGTEAQIETFLKTVLPWLASLSYVTRYAYFYDAPNYLLNAAGTALSTQGQIFNTY